MSNVPALPSRFSAEKLREAVQGYFADVPPNHLHAQLEYTLADGTVRFVAAARVNDEWKIGGSLAWHLRSGKVESVRLVGSWEWGKNE